MPKIEKPERLAKFARLLLEWRKVVSEYRDPDITEERASELEVEGGPWDHEMMLAWQVVTYPIEEPGLLEDKFEVLAHYSWQAAVDDCLTPLIFTGLATVRTDCAHLCNFPKTVPDDADASAA